MKVINEVFPSRPEQFQGMQEAGPDGPVFMVNLLKFKEKAEYDDGRETELTGRQAYSIYGAGVAEILKDYGGRLFFMGDITFLSLGQVEELWDEVAIAVYPERRALLNMSASQAWRDLAIHRSAGLQGQLNIESVMTEQTKHLPWMALLMKAMDI